MKDEGKVSLLSVAHTFNCLMTLAEILPSTHFVLEVIEVSLRMWHVIWCSQLVPSSPLTPLPAGNSYNSYNKHCFPLPEVPAEHCIEGLTPWPAFKVSWHDQTPYWKIFSFINVPCRKSIDGDFDVVNYQDGVCSNLLVLGLGRQTPK